MKVELQTLTGKKLSLTVEAEDTIQQVKQKLWKEHKVKEQVRILQGQDELTDDETLSTLGIVDGTVLQMLKQPEEKIEVVVRTFKLGELKMNISDNCTTKELRNELRCQGRLGVVAKLHDICLENGEKIEDETLPMHFFGITDGSVLRVTSDETIRLSISFMVCDEVYMSFSGSNLIEEIQQKVWDYFDLSEYKYRGPFEWKNKREKNYLFKPFFDKQQLIFFVERNGQYIDIAPNGSRRVKDYELKNGETLCVGLLDESRRQSRTLL